MKWLNSLVVLISMALGGMGLWNAKEMTASPQSEGVVSTEGAKFVGGPLGSALGLLVTWFGGPAAIKGSLKFVLDAFAKSVDKQHSFLTPKAGAEGDQVDATRFIMNEPNIDLSIVLTGDASRDVVGRKKIGEVLDHYASGGPAKT